jgi:NAD(P)-dependent dehydrogenase (short-subunit alcohol dehydrogenase family)
VANGIRQNVPMIDVAAPAELFSLAHKVVVITGASSGLGARWAPVMAAAGADVVLAARREQELATVAAAIPGSLAVTADLTLGQDRQRLVQETLHRHGKIDVLVNNAAAAASSPAADTSLEEFRELIDADLTSVFALTQLAGAAMVAAGRGSIINVASLAAERCVDRYPLAAYSAAKAGVVALTRCLAAEWGPHGIRVNAVGPAFFPTRQSGFLSDPEQVAWIESHTALRRTPKIGELDGAVVFLASDASSYITGQHLLADGGWSVY